MVYIQISAPNQKFQHHKFNNSIYIISNLVIDTNLLRLMSCLAHNFSLNGLIIYMYSSNLMRGQKFWFALSQPKIAFERAKKSFYPLSFALSSAREGKKTRKTLLRIHSNVKCCGEIIIVFQKMKEKRLIYILDLRQKPNFSQTHFIYHMVHTAKSGHDFHTTHTHTYFLNNMV